MVRQQVSSSAGWDASPGRLDERGLPEGQLLSFRRFRYLHLIFGVCVPAAAVTAESLTGWSAAAYANPIPNRWFLSLALGAPLSNLIAWLALCPESPPAWLAANPRLPRLANSFALAVSFGYALLLLPIVPAALILTIFAVGLLPLAPFFSFYTAWRFRQGLRAQKPATLLRFLCSVPALSAARSLLCHTTE